MKIIQNKQTKQTKQTNKTNKQNKQKKTNKKNKKNKQIRQTNKNKQTKTKTKTKQKDVFQTFYEKYLARRLIGGTSASDDLERSMLSNLTTACGVEYTHKLNKMFQDVTISKKLSDEFKEQQRNLQQSTGTFFFLF